MPLKSIAQIEVPTTTKKSKRKIGPKSGSKKAKKLVKAKAPKIDGLGPDNLKLIHKAVRQVWSWSAAWRIAKKRALHEDGFYRCENKKCAAKGQPVPKVFVDHIEPVGEVGGPDYIKRMFIPSHKLQCLCKKCHDAKTKEEKAAPKVDEDFF